MLGIRVRADAIFSARLYPLASPPDYPLPPRRRKHKSREMLREHREPLHPYAAALITFDRNYLPRLSVESGRK